MENVILIKKGISEYQESWDLQKSLFDEVLRERKKNFLLLTEHTPVITIGRGSDTHNLIANPAYLESQGIKVIKIDRGGDITFHGPGQLIGYPILNLSLFKPDVHWYLRSLEQVIINTLMEYNIQSARLKDLTGVWIKNNKICAIGIKVSRWITMHGFALNVSTNLKYFQHIIPCGIKNKGVTSISAQVGNNVAINDVINRLINHFKNKFEVNIVESE